MQHNQLNEKEINRREIALTRRYDEITKLTEDARLDPVCMALPHPARILNIAPSHPDIALVVIAGFSHENRLLELFRHNISTTDLWTTMFDENCTSLQRFINESTSSAAIDGGFNAGSAGAIFHALRYQILNGTLFSFDDRLLDLLEKTDIDLDILMSDIRLPFAHIYIELGSRSSDLVNKRTLHNDSSGEHILEGAYVSMTKRMNGESVLEVTMTGSPVGKSEIGDDAIEWLSMQSDGNRTIREALHNAFHQKENIFQKYHPLFKRGDVNTERISFLEQQSAQRLELIIKALLYLNMPHIRTEVCKNRTEADKIVARINSTAHKRKAQRKALRVYNSILVLPPIIAHQDGNAIPIHSDAKTNKTHWRRGHFRTQRFGPELAQRKIIWISPVLVNPEQLGSVVDKRQYKVLANPAQ